MSEDNRTKIKFEYEGEAYCLVFTADSIKKMERNGFKFGKIDEQVLTAPEELFAGAFIANHPTVPKKKRIEIYKALKECEEEDSDTTIMDAIGIMLSEAVESIKPKGNVSWRMGD